MPVSFTASLRDWQGFYEILGESSATLTGLMFVAATVGARLFTAATLPFVRNLISPTLGHFALVLVLSTVMLVPTQTRPGLARELGVLGLIGLYRLGFLYPILRRLHRRMPLERRHWVTQLALPVVGSLCALVAVGGLWLQWAPALDVLGFSALLLVLVGVVNAWDVTLQGMASSPEDIAAIESIPRNPRTESFAAQCFP